MDKTAEKATTPKTPRILRAEIEKELTTCQNVMAHKSTSEAAKASLRATEYALGWVLNPDGYESPPTIAALIGGG